MKDKFRRTRSATDILISAVLIVAGLLSIILIKDTVGDIVGAIVLIAGLICLAALHSLYRDVETGAVYRKLTVEYPVSEKACILAALSAGDPQALPRVSRDGRGGLLAELYYNSEDSYMHLFEFSSYNYVSCSGYVKLPASAVGALRK